MTGVHSTLDVDTLYFTDLSFIVLFKLIGVILIQKYYEKCILSYKVVNIITFKYNDKK